MKKGNKYLRIIKPRLELIEAWARRGLTDDEIIRNLSAGSEKIGSTTWYEYLNKYPDLENALMKGRFEATAIVENALFKKSKGYRYKELTKERVLNPDTGKYELTVTKVVYKQQPGDFQAQKYILENRAPERWSRNPEPNMDSDSINMSIQSLRSLLSNPLPERQIGSVNDE